MRFMSRKYSIGLDIGVASVGWACMTSDFRIPKYNERYAIGVREFEAADTAEERRIQRGTRRRYNRRIKRIQLLQQSLEALLQQHPNFLMKTEATEKHFWRNNNQFENRSLSEVLADLGENTRKYPTIFHLRQALLSENKPFDSRLIYIVLHNLVKYRGHFLNENMEWNNSSNNETTIDLTKEYFSILTNLGYETDDLLDSNHETTLHDIIQILKSNDYTNNDKRNSIKKLIGKEFHDPITLIVGLKSDMHKLFPNSEGAAIYQSEKLKMSFADEDITEVYEKLTDEEKLVIDQANKVYQHILLNDLLDGHNSVAAAKVTSYNQFSEDLKLLKDVFNKYLGEKAYRDMFITTRKKWTQYQQTRKNNLLCTFDQFLKIHATEDKFYRDLKKTIENIIKKEQNAELQAVLDKLNNNQFLQKQKSYLNAAIPHQNNVYEAETILKNQQQFHPEITDNVIEKVRQIINFRIPYYIGPLVKKATDDDFGWAIRKDEQQHVLPWTIDEVIDRSNSAEQFINRMTSYCAYLTNEKVLPKHSLTYELFEVLNELNGIQIRRENDLPDKDFRLSEEEKLWIINNVFKKYKNVTHTILLRELRNSDHKELVLDTDTDNLKQVYGTQKENKFGSSLSSYITLSEIFNNIEEVDNDMLEELIYWITVFEDKEIIKLKIKEKYKDINDKQINRLTNLPFAGWGRLSNKLINELPADKNSGETILDIMTKDALVFMEILSIEKYNLNERITTLNLKNNESYTKIKYKDIAELQGSPALKKGIWQAILIIEELVEIFGEPEHIMIEFAREDGPNIRTKSRQKHLADLQKAISKDEKELKAFLKEHSHYEEQKYKNDRLFLYITQEGKCLYTGEPLVISRLQDYEVDHILPRSFVKDDSIDNLALVTYTANQDKGDTKMPLEIMNEEEKFQQKQHWKKLFDNKLISQSKYFKLMRESFSDQDKESFFARQLVETRQITKHVKDLLNDRFEHTEIHPVNANIVTNLRKHADVVKIRDLNNKHHAIDAALAVLVVQFIVKQYGHNFLNFNFKFQEARKKWRDMLTKYNKNFFLFSDIDKYDKFTHYSTGEILSGREFMSTLNSEIPWQTTKKIGSSESAFYKQTLHSPQVKTAKYSSDKTVHGVYDEMKNDSTYLISYKELNKKGKEIIKNDFVDLYVIEKYQLKEKGQKDLALFLASKTAKGEVVDATIHTKIEKFQMVSYEGHEFYYISSGEMHNAKQLLLPNKVIDTINKVRSNPNENNDPTMLANTFKNIANEVIKQYSEFLPDSRIDLLKNYHSEIVDAESFNHGVTELFKTTSASAARSQLFGARYVKKPKPEQLLFNHSSITGLRYRKPKSYKQDLWSQ